MKRREFLRNDLLPGMTELVAEQANKFFARIFEVIEKETLKDVKYFVNKRGVDVNTKNEGGKTLLQWAIELDKIQIVKFLIANGAIVEGKTPLHLAVELGKVKIVKLLASWWGANVNAKDVDGKTPLHLAVELDKNKIVRILTYKWADVNAKDANDLTPLHLAVIRRYDDIAKFLASNGANVCMTNELLDWSTKNENMVVIDWIRHYEPSCGEDFSGQEF